MANSPLELSKSIKEQALINNHKFPKGTSQEYTDRVNKAYEEALPLLREKGYDVDSFTTEGMEKLFNDLFENYRLRQNEVVDNIKRQNEKLPLDKRLPTGVGNELWNNEFKPLFNALNAASDKVDNEAWIKNAPYGYPED